MPVSRLVCYSEVRNIFDFDGYYTTVKYTVKYVDDLPENHTVLIIVYHWMTIRKKRAKSLRYREKNVLIDNGDYERNKG